MEDLSRYVSKVALMSPPIIKFVLVYISYSEGNIVDFSGYYDITSFSVSDSFFLIRIAAPLA